MDLGEELGIGGLNPQQVAVRARIVEPLINLVGLLANA